MIITPIVSLMDCIFPLPFSGLQYRMPEAYDEDGGVNQEKRFAVALQRYRSVTFRRKNAIGDP